MSVMTIGRTAALSLIQHAGWKSGAKWDNSRLSDKLAQLPEVLVGRDDVPGDTVTAELLEKVVDHVKEGGTVTVIDDAPEPVEAVEDTPAKSKKSKEVSKPQVAEPEPEIVAQADDDGPDEDADESVPDMDRMPPDAVEDEPKEIKPAKKQRTVPVQKDLPMADLPESQPDDGQPESDVAQPVAISPDWVMAGQIFSRPGAVPGAVEVLLQFQPGLFTPRESGHIPSLTDQERPSKQPKAPKQKKEKVEKAPKLARITVAALLLKKIGVDSELTDDHARAVDSQYGRPNTRQSRLCLADAQAIIQSWSAGRPLKKTPFAVAGAVVKRLGDEADSEQGVALLNKTLGKDCNTAEIYIKNAVRVVEAYNGK